MSITIKAYTNCDTAYIAWQAASRIAGCRGFALYRRRSATDPGSAVETWVGFDGDTAAPGTTKPSTQWPIQKFMWSDYMVHPGDTVQYRVVPMVGAKDDLQASADLASDWTPPLAVSATAGPGTSAYFNRGIVAAQWLSRRLAGATTGDEQKQLGHIINDPEDPIRQFLAGPLLQALRTLLQEVAHTDQTVYAALFELNDPELIGLLQALGKRANVILANGVHGESGDDENAAARAQLRDTISLYDRMVGAGHLAHNKFLVVCDAAGQPHKAWTGSTNWQETGLCTQANNGILFEQPEMAALFKAQWDHLKDAGDDFPPSLIASNNEKKVVHAGGCGVTTWFTPVRNAADLADARALITGATQGILFLMFDPGPQGTLLNDIIDRTSAGSAAYDPDLYIHGVLNQDPSTAAHPIVGLFHRGGQRVDANIDVVLPEAINQRLRYWIPEIKRYQHAWAMVHSKVIVIDPFGPQPVVMTGSHNMGPRASADNDDNLVIIAGDSNLAAAYAVNIMGIYNQYRWRYYRLHSDHPDQWVDLCDNDTWQDKYFSGAPQRELKFWLSQG